MPAVTVPQALELALQHHQAERLSDAEAVCRQILNVQPNHTGALRLLGIVARQAGRPDSAVEWLRRAAAVDPGTATAHFDLGTAYGALGRFDEAITCYRRALELNPNLPEARYNLGNALNNRGQVMEGIAEYQRALELRPDYVEAYNNLAAALAAQQRFAEAAETFRQALRFKPDSAAIHTNLGNALMGSGQIDDAVAAHRRALRCDPNYSNAHNNLANALRAQDKLDEAIAEYRRAIELQPDNAEAGNNLGVALVELGRPEEAVAVYQRALQLKPDLAEIQTNLGNAFMELSQFEPAVAAHGRALQLRPDYAEAWNNLGNALAESGRSDEALAAFGRALTLKPDRDEAHHNRANTLANLGRLDEAIAGYRRAVELAPEESKYHSSLILRLHLHPKLEETAVDEARRRWNQQLTQAVKSTTTQHANDRDPERRLRIGYVSPDLRNHVVGLNLRPLFRCHDPQGFEVFCYSGVVRPDDLTQEFRTRAQHWRDTVRVSDVALAEMIKTDGIDILVDLTQHSAGNRLPLFAHRPAPVQMSFAGYPESTGLEAIEYRISDRRLEGNAESEAVGAADFRLPTSEMEPALSLSKGPPERLYLLDSFWCYEPHGAEIGVRELPAKGNGYVTFGSLVNFSKINEPVLNLWARVLRQVPGSRLLLLCGPGSGRARTLEFLRQEGVDGVRVEFVMPQPRDEYLKQYHRIDVVLDTFPYNGHTTSLDALWMGVPVVGLAGKRPLARAGFSQLSNLGLPELAPFSEEEFVRTAVDLAQDLPRLAGLRTTLRSRMESSVLMDAPRFARQIENAYRAAWRRWCTEGP